MKCGKLEYEVEVKGMDKLQDVADILREIQERVTIRDNQNVYVNITTIIGDGGDDDED